MLLDVIGIFFVIGQGFFLDHLVGVALLTLGGRLCCRSSELGGGL